jgi:hypothetical protein
MEGVAHLGSLRLDLAGTGKGSVNFTHCRLSKFSGCESLVDEFERADDEM